MKRSFLLLVSVALAACGDDAPPSDHDAPDSPMDAGRPDLPDAATHMLDAATGLPGDPPAPGRSPEQDAAAPTALPDAGTADAASFDAQVEDAALADAEADAASCAAAGERCDQGACCDGTWCVTSSEAPYPICGEPCAQASDCASGCCTELPGSGPATVCAPLLHCDAAPPDPRAPLTGISCFNGLSVYDSVGTYMGKATARFFETEGVCNSSGQYGKFGSNSNNLWRITSDAYSSILAFSAVIGCGSDFPVLAYVSKYQGRSDKRVVDPDYLCDVLSASNL